MTDPPPPAGFASTEDPAHLHATSLLGNSVGEMKSSWRSLFHTEKSA